MSAPQRISFFGAFWCALVRFGALHALHLHQLKILQDLQAPHFPSIGQENLEERIAFAVCCVQGKLYDMAVGESVAARGCCVASLLFFLAAVRATAALPPIQTVFVIVLENQPWSGVKGATNAPYLNNTLLPMASCCEGYFNVPGLHPSLPNYLWMEAGTNFGIFDDNNPADDHQNTTNHLVTRLASAGVSWRTYQEDISGSTVPLTSTGGYTPRHNPFVYFDDVTGTNNPNCAYGIAHIRPYAEFRGDLTNNTIARYNFITPNLCHNGHDPCYPLYDGIRQADTWLSSEVPRILNSASFQTGGALFITWDESLATDRRIGMVVLSPFARGGGYFNTNYYTHSSFLRTMQEIFAVGPFLGDAASANDLSDLFTPLSLRVLRLADGRIQLTALSVVGGGTNIIQASSDLVGWTNIHTNSPTGNSFVFVDNEATNLSRRFYRLAQLP